MIGAGNYADSRYGAAACTGRGEMAMRACTAFSAVLYMKMGRSLEEAGRAARELREEVARRSAPQGNQARQPENSGEQIRR